MKNTWFMVGAQQVRVWFLKWLRLELWASVYGVAQSRTRLKRLSGSSSRTYGVTKSWTQLSD